MFVLFRGNEIAKKTADIKIREKSIYSIAEKDSTLRKIIKKVYQSKANRKISINRAKSEKFPFIFIGAYLKIVHVLCVVIVGWCEIECYE